MNFASRLARMFICRDHYDFSVWMRKQNTKQLRAAIA